MLLIEVMMLARDMVAVHAVAMLAEVDDGLMRSWRIVTITGATTLAAIATGIIQTAVVAVGSSPSSNASSSAFRLLHQTTPFGSGVLEPDLHRSKDKEEEI